MISRHATQISIVCSSGKETPFPVTKKKNSEKNSYEYLSIAINTFCYTLLLHHDHSTGKQTGNKKAMA